MKRRPPETQDHVRYNVQVTVRENFAKFRFPASGAAMGIPRDGINYYETIGRWFCGQVGAMSKADDAAGRSI